VSATGTFVLAARGRAGRFRGVFPVIVDDGQFQVALDLREYFRVSPPSVHQMLVGLERAGFIRRQPRVARSIELLVDPKYLPDLL